jgi:ABC-type transporter Mla subunit MlaD
MKLLFALAIAAVVALPLCAQAQLGPRNAPKATNADAQRVVQSISNDKAKTQAYCDMTKIGDQIEQAQQKHDDKKADELAQQADELAGKLGPEWDALMNGLQSVDENSKEGQAIGVTLQGLDKLCAN